MKRALWLMLFAVALAACRTEIVPVLRGAKPALYRPKPGECEVHDYPMASDVPAGSQNLGWVTVKREKDDEAAFEALRKAVCERGGNAFSQAHWIRAAGASVADQPSELEANSWLTP